MVYHDKRVFLGSIHFPAEFTLAEEAGGAGQHNPIPPLYEKSGLPLCAALYHYIHKSQLRQLHKTEAERVCLWL